MKLKMGSQLFNDVTAELFELKLNSRGGSLEEAMEIGRWVRKNKRVFA